MITAEEASKLSKENKKIVTVDSCVEDIVKSITFACQIGNNFVHVIIQDRIRDGVFAKLAKLGYKYKYRLPETYKISWPE